MPPFRDTETLNSSTLLDVPARTSLVEEFVGSVVYSAVQGPAEAMAQVADKLTGSDLQGWVKRSIACNPQEAPFFSAHWAVQQAGNAIGLLPWVVAVHRGTIAVSRKFAFSPASTVLAEKGKLSSLGQPWKTIASGGIESGLTGFVIGSMLSPVAPDELGNGDFLKAKARHALGSASTFATLSMSANSMSMAAEKMATRTPLISRMLASPAISGIVAAVPGGFVSANVESKLAGNGWASGQDTAKAIAGFSLLGLGFGFAESSARLRLASEGGRQRTDVNMTVSITKKNPEAPSKNKGYVSDSIDSNGVRTVLKEDGTRVAIYPSGKVTVERTSPKLEQIDKTVPRGELEPRLRHKPPDFSHLPIAQRPVNIGSSSAELTATEMSNFAHTPFNLGGKTFGSVEGFYVWLKWAQDPQRQSQAASMWGAEAKKFGKASKNTKAVWDGAEITLGSPEHHAVVKAAIKAKLEQHPAIAKRFADTYPREIIHDLGYPENPNTKLPGKDFSRILTELRQELIDGKIITIEGSLQELQAKALMREIKLPQNAFPVSSLLRSSSNESFLKGHPVERYARAMEGFEKKSVKFVGAGADSVVMELLDGTLLKLTGRHLTERMGTRPFDLEIIERGVVDNGVSKVFWFIQPRAQTPVSYAEYQAFKVELERHQFILNDAGQHQLGIYNGAVKLLDPFAVQKKPLN